MAHCPNCKNKLPFVKIVFLSPSRNTMTCPHCQKELGATDTHLLSIIGGIQGGVGGALFCASFYLYQYKMMLWLLPLFGSLLTLIITSFIQVTRIKFKIKS